MKYCHFKVTVHGKHSVLSFNPIERAKGNLTGASMGLAVGSLGYRAAQETCTPIYSEVWEVKAAPAEMWTRMARGHASPSCTASWPASCHPSWRWHLPACPQRHPSYGGLQWDCIQVCTLQNTSRKTLKDLYSHCVLQGQIVRAWLSVQVTDPLVDIAVGTMLQRVLQAHCLMNILALDACCHRASL